MSSECIRIRGRSRIASLFNYFLSLLFAYYLGKNFSNNGCSKSPFKKGPIRLKNIEDLTDAEIKKVRVQQEPCRSGNCTAKKYKKIEWPRVDDQHPIIWVGGMPRSGTTLMRAILDVHPDVRCGEETRVVPRMLEARKDMQIVFYDGEFSSANGLFGESKEAVDDVTKRFILQVIEKHGPVSRRLCNKDPFALKFMSELSGWYPNSKFIYMIRDARSVAHSIFSREVTISGYDIKNFTDLVHKIWGRSSACPFITNTWFWKKNRFFEKLFLGLKWNDALIHHEEHIGTDISLSNMERSTDQVVKATYTSALSSWEGKVSDEELDNVEKMAPLMKEFGYKPELHFGSYDHFLSSKQSKSFKKTFPSGV
ncbi:Oidioi.mRNA.OKI2018_I69.chr2.g4099.t1.cds [Oikopleura dioica]|uniref:Protein-tyrosine sulfotransferase n=1 Tax=Oikopleura dioica TaxID=34765 RepID=A0ABN7T1R4_OIKDI|nr:Oidioi.mRNA.OKI2018_I69.chr2.g4099.t1.cds [Oikopleura dioica]